MRRYSDQTGSQPVRSLRSPVLHQDRVREGLNSAGFAESYREYLNIRGKSTEDPLLPEVLRRAGR